MDERRRNLKRDRAAKAAAQRPTIKDIAERCGVHPSTVSRALSPAMKHLVADDVAKRIHAAVHALGYRLNMAAAGLRTVLIHVPSPHLKHARPFQSRIVACLRDGLADLAH